MRVLLLGGHGMAGHVIAKYMRQHTIHDVTVTVRQPMDLTCGPSIDSVSDSPAAAVAAERQADVRLLDAKDFEKTAALIEELKPDVIVNAVGILNQQAEDQPLDAYLINGLLPHWLRHIGKREGARLIHISSDCVFLGDQGDYGEEDRPDGITVYARSKALGEIVDPRCLTIRTSIIGPEIRKHGIGLLQWFLTRSGQVQGYRNVKWNGVTTLELAKSIVWAMDHPDTGGLVHLTAPQTVSKHALLLLIQQIFDKRDIALIPSEEPILNRTLSVTRADGFGYLPPDYATMLAELRAWMDAE